MSRCSAPTTFSRMYGLWPLIETGLRLYVLRASTPASCVFCGVFIGEQETEESTTNVDPTKLSGIL